MTWRLLYTRRAQRDLKRLDRLVQERVVAALERFASEQTGDVRRLAGGRPEWRLRVGDWRVLFVYDRPTWQHPRATRPCRATAPTAVAAAPVPVGRAGGELRDGRVPAGAPASVLRYAIWQPPQGDRAGLRSAARLSPVATCTCHRRPARSSSARARADRGGVRPVLAAAGFRLVRSVPTRSPARLGVIEAAPIARPQRGGSGGGPRDHR
ncbi:MAG: type II toxin-antitoxin system RelE/ParE family toxin [Dehalococcoidia bacterium]